MSENIILFLLGQVLTAAGIYAAIRADLREHSVRIGALEKQYDRNSEQRGYWTEKYRRNTNDNHNDNRDDHQ